MSIHSIFEVATILYIIIDTKRKLAEETQLHKIDYIWYWHPYLGCALAPYLDWGSMFLDLYPSLYQKYLKTIDKVRIT
jgi:hypothetical protein